MTPDVDECDMGTDGCAQNCSNTNGSFVCSCGVGYVLAVDDLDCLGNVSLSSRFVYALFPFGTISSQKKIMTMSFFKLNIRKSSLRTRLAPTNFISCSLQRDKCFSLLTMNLLKQVIKNSVERSHTISR